MQTAPLRVTIHMAASLDGFIARRDGRVDWLEAASDQFDSGEVMSPESLAEFLRTIDCYVAICCISSRRSRIETARWDSGTR